jgi:hypothetical protein
MAQQSPKIESKDVHVSADPLHKPSAAHQPTTHVDTIDKPTTSTAGPILELNIDLWFAEFLAWAISPERIDCQFNSIINEERRRR